ncbi:hypothetical protein NDU88_001367 [Pleurodeles waltl]|uniref:Uncharacterized protein n=1 Tax=Pleurodeles waltl TaxID=8319 RepID=A0AAV7TIC9_PLEWA|nr:hypothetical protein NDU88_001367 [Pleurodeles waltl]
MTSRVAQCDEEFPFAQLRREGGALSLWAGNAAEEVGSTVDQMQLDTSMKKEVAKWYWLMLDIVDEEFNLPEEIWSECLPELQLKDLW